MPLVAPGLDDRTFDDLVDEARRRIARYNPEWTDFNESDPGATLVDLFAWLTETMLYRLNRLPELNYIKFLELIGQKPATALPATAHVTFTPQDGVAAASVPRGTQIAGPPGPDGQPLLFETQDPLDLVMLPLSQVQVFTASGFHLVTEANSKPGVSFAPFGWQPQAGNALYLGFEPPETLPIPLFPPETCLRVLLPEPARVGTAIRTDAVGANGRLPAPPVSLVFEYRRSTTEAFWRPLATYRDESVAFTRDGYVTFRGPDGVEPSVEGKVEDPLLWLRCRIAAGAYPADPPAIDMVLLNTVPAKNVATVRDEPVGISDGSPEEVYELENRPVSELALEVRDVDDVLKPWRLVDDFLASTPDDDVYVLDDTRGQIRFGDGTHGRIPVAGSDIVARSYRTGGGEAGNAASDTIAELVTYVEGVAEVTNLRAATGGQNEQTLEDLKRSAPQALRNRGRAVTAEDLKVLAEAVPGVLMATVVPLMHPDHPDVEVPGAVSVIVVPIASGPRPEPTADLIERVAAALDPKRPLTAEVYVKGPTYQAITVIARLTVKPFAALGDAQRKVRAEIEKRLDPRQRDFAKDFHPSELYDAILDVDDVEAVETMRVFGGDRELNGLDDRVIVPLDGLVYDSGRHEIAVVRTRDR